MCNDKNNVPAIILLDKLGENDLYEFWSDSHHNTIVIPKEQ